MTIKTKLRFRQSIIPEIAKRYEYTRHESELVELRPMIIKRGCLLKNELITLAFWKAPRIAGKVQKNSEEFVNEITRLSLQPQSERARIEILTILDGVSWPMASVILHFFHRDPYPIMDFRALWSVSLEIPSQYNFDFWQVYVCFCRKLAEKNKLDMRTLDRALWQYSKENQNRKERR